MPQELELTTGPTTQLICVKSAVLRGTVMTLMGRHGANKQSEAQWIGNILKRLQLIAETRRKPQTDGDAYAVRPLKVIDMMCRYAVDTVSSVETKNFHNRANPKDRTCL